MDTTRRIKGAVTDGREAGLPQLRRSVRQRLLRRPDSRRVPRVQSGFPYRHRRTASPARPKTQAMSRNEVPDGDPARSGSWSCRRQAGLRRGRQVACRRRQKQYGQEHRRPDGRRARSRWSRLQPTSSTGCDRIRASPVPDSGPPSTPCRIWDTESSGVVARFGG